MQLVVLSSVTDLKAHHEGHIALVGSHGSAATGRYALACGLRGLICHDAGIGLDEAGVGALAVFDAQNLPAATVSHASARIGDAEDMAVRGVISRVNNAAGTLGMCMGMSVREGLELLENAAPDDGKFHSTRLSGNEIAAIFKRQAPDAPQTSVADSKRILILDSASLMCASDNGAIVVTGSHGGLPGNSITRAAKATPYIAIFNDAGIGIDDAGIGRLQVLQNQGVSAACVDAKTARIGDGLSTFETGIISVANTQAQSLGARKGLPIKDWIEQLTSVTRAPV